MIDKNCLFCKIGSHQEPAKIVWEDEDYIAINNKFPVSPVHVLVMPKEHIRKTEVGTSANRMFWGKIMSIVFGVVELLGLDKTGYKIVNNGAGYNHFDHEHIHVLGGSKTEPGGKT